MAEPVSPVLLSGAHPNERVVGAPEDCPVECMPMPALFAGNMAVVRWRLTDEEKMMVALTGDVWIAFSGGLPVHRVTGVPPMLDENGDVAFCVVDPLSTMNTEIDPKAPR